MSFILKRSINGNPFQTIVSNVEYPDQETAMNAALQMAQAVPSYETHYIFEGNTLIALSNDYNVAIFRTFIPNITLTITNSIGSEPSVFTSKDMNQLTREAITLVVNRDYEITEYVVNGFNALDNGVEIYFRFGKEGFE